MVSLQAALAALVLSAGGQTVLLDFYGDRCGPCRAMAPTVQALIDAGYPVQRINVEQKQNQALEAQHRVGPIPCFVMLVDGREVDRVVGGTTYSRLERMCQAGAAAKAQAASTAAQNNAPPAVQPASFNAPVAPASFGSLPPVAAEAVNPSDDALLAVSVRLRIEDHDGHSCGSGTIIDARDGEALILTCGHIFRDSKGKGKITVDLFGPHAGKQVVGRLISYDLTSDVGLVAIQTPGQVAAARVAPPEYRVSRGMPVASVGCNNGQPPTARRSQVTSIDKFLGPPNIQVAGQPVEGRSGGGLFSSDGYVIGVCNAADPSDREGLFAAPGSIHAMLDRCQLSFVYKPSVETLAAAPATAAPPIPVSFDAPAASPASMPPHEQAALAEIRRRAKEGADVTIVIHPRDKGQSEVLMLDRASNEFLRQLPVAADAKPIQNSRHETSLDTPKSPNVLLEWSRPGGQ